MSANKIYNNLIELYPSKYLRHFRSSQLQLFTDLYLEELDRGGTFWLARFWRRILKDLFISLPSEYHDELRRDGPQKILKNQFGVDGFVLAALILLIPFFLMTGFDLIFRAILHNAAVTNALYSSGYWTGPVIFTIAMGLPALAALLGLYSISRREEATKIRLLSARGIKSNLGGLAVVAVFFGILVLLVGHDYFPCVGHSLLNQGLGNFFNILRDCRSA
jgi:hypothetical protein